MHACTGDCDIPPVELMSGGTVRELGGKAMACSVISHTKPLVIGM